MQVVLAMFRSDGERRSFSVVRDMTIIGRREDCDLRIPLTDISRKHCRIIKDGDSVRLEDLGSSNGTYHNSVRVQEAVLQPGDTIKMGPVEFVVQIDGVPADEDLAPNAGLAAAGVADDLVADEPFAVNNDEDNDLIADMQADGSGADDVAAGFLAEADHAFIEGDSGAGLTPILETPSEPGTGAEEEELAELEPLPDDEPLAELEPIEEDDAAVATAPDPVAEADPAAEVEAEAAFEPTEPTESEELLPPLGAAPGEKGDVSEIDDWLAVDDEIEPETLAESSGDNQADRPVNPAKAAPRTVDNRPPAEPDLADLVFLDDEAAPSNDQRRH